MALPWVFLCGLLCDRTIWDDVVEQLGVVDTASVVSFADFSTIGAMAEHVLDRAPERFRLAGHSMGGRVALEVIARAPERVASLALLNTGVHGPAGHERESRGRLVDLAHAEGMRRLAEEWLPPMMGVPEALASELLPRLFQMVERFTPQQFTMQINALLNRPDAAVTLAAVDVPTLLLSGTNDRWSPLEQHHQMLGLAPHAMLVAVPDAGHMAPIEAPADVAHALAALT